MTPQELLTKTLQLMQRHIYQIEQRASDLNNMNQQIGLTFSDSQVLERYAKIFIATSRQPPEDMDDELAGLSDDELLRQLREV